MNPKAIFAINELLYFCQNNNLVNVENIVWKQIGPCVIGYWKWKKGA